MGLFVKKRKFVDFTGRKNESIPEKTDTFNSMDSQNAPRESSGIFGIFGGGGVSSTASNPDSVTSDYADLSSVETGSTSYDAEERRKKLAKRLGDMTDKLEELSNQIYHIQQRIEVLERKMEVRGI
jgi:chromosome segregation ATPase